MERVERLWRRAWTIADIEWTCCVWIALDLELGGTAPGVIG